MNRTELVTATFTEDELVEILEIARIAMRRIPWEIGDKLDLRDDYLYELEEKITEALS